MRTKESDKKLFLLDAYALIFRAYFAFSKNPRINSKGLNTSAIFGFVNAMLEIINNEKPTHLAVVFDPPTKLKRAEIYPEYKANRNETPEDIKLSVPYIFDILKAMNIPIVMENGYEADDVIGTLAKEAEQSGFLTYMMTPDKDFGQLVSDNVFMYKPGRSGKPAEVWGVPEICERFEIKRVEQVIDILGLWGDAVDNIPGVPGVGEKTSKKLIGLYDSMEGIYENLDKLKGKQLENFINFKEQAFLSKHLATIVTDLPHDFHVDQAIMEEPNKEDLKRIFSDLEFRRLAERILGESISVTPDKKGAQMDLFASPNTGEEVVVEESELKNLENTPHNYSLCDSEEKINSLIDELTSANSFCFDTETTSLNVWEAELVGVAFSLKSGEGYYVPFSDSFEESKEVIGKFKSLLENEVKEKIGHNLKYDINVLRKYDIQVKGPLFDTMVAHYLLHPDNNRRSMDVLAENELGYTPMSITELIGKKGKTQKSMREVPVDQACEYACEDTDITLQLKELFEPELKKGKVFELFRDVEMPLILVLSEMEEHGVNLDTDLLLNYSKVLEKEISEIEARIYDEAGMEFLISSPKQVGEVLFDHLKVSAKPKKTKTGQYATGEDVLQKLRSKHPVVDLLLEFREVVKLKNTYVDPLPELVNAKTHHLHTSYNQVVAATGRLSSDKPNLQNIPIRSERGKEIRKAFIPSEGRVLIAADYSQIELRIIAALSKDVNMMEAFQSGKDIHASTAAKVYNISIDEVTREQRSHAKMVNFGIIYGISAFGLSQRLGISRKEAKQIIDSYFEQFPGIKEYMNASIQIARENGYVETVLGRRRHLKDINSGNAVVRGFAERNAINSPIQGSAADMIKLAMIKIQDYMKSSNLKSKMILQIHDELIFDAIPGEVESLQKKVKDLMREALDIGVRMEVDANTGMNWLEAH
jgi:DNA polymerase-1